VYLEFSNFHNHNLLFIALKNMGAQSSVSFPSLYPKIFGFSYRFFGCFLLINISTSILIISIRNVFGKMAKELKKARCLMPGILLLWLALWWGINRCRQ
jgi:hypothetical protein